MGTGIQHNRDSSALRNAFQLVGIGVAYFLIHHLAFLFPDAEKVLMAIWPAAGVGLAALLLSSRRLWPAIAVVLFVSGHLSDLIAGRPFLASLGFMAANVLESLGCAWLILRTCGDRPTFRRVREVVALLAAAAFVNAATSLLGASAARLASVASFWTFCETWWISDGLGILLVTPAIIVWVGGPTPSAGRRWPATVEACAFLVLWCAVAWQSFGGKGIPAPHLPYLLVALLAWSALRFGMKGTTFALVLLAVITVTSSTVRQGPLLWGGEDPTHRLLLAQLFIWVVTVVGLLLATSYTEAKSAERSAREDQARVRALGDNLPDGMIYQVVRELNGTMRFVYVSAGVERLHGFSAEVALRDPRTLYDSIFEEDRATVAAAEEVSARDMSTLDLTVRSRRRDGQLCWMRISSSPRRLADGRILWDGIQRDITENRRSENEARRQAMLLEAQLNASIEGVLVVDSDGNKILQNKRCIELWKIPAHIAENQDDRLQVDFVKNSIKDPEAFLRQIAHLYTHPNESSRDEVEFKDGTVLDRYSAPILGRDGTLIGRIWTFRDITQHKQTEARLRRYELLAHHSNDIVIFIRRNDGRILEANVAAQHAYGYSHEELLSLTVRDLRTLSVRGLAEEQMAEAESRGLRFETIHQRKDGTTFPAEVSSGGAIIDGTRTLVSVIRDITERKQAEEALRESEEKFAKAFHDAPVMVAITDIASRVYVDVNEESLRISGYTRNEVIGHTAADLGWIPVKDRDNLVRELQRHGRVVGLEMTFRTKDGRRLEGLVNAEQLMLGKRACLLTVTTDMTERKRNEQERANLQEQLAHAQKMESVGRLAGGVAHDFNNMLGVILGHVELALEEVDSEDPLRDRLGEIQKAAQRSADLTRQLLAFARKQTIVPKVLDLNGSVGSLLKMLQRLVGENIKLDWQPGTNLWPILIDPSQVDQILANLCVNARDAIADLGTITIRTQNITSEDLCAEHTEAAPGEYVRLTVSDDGCGMDKQTLERIFEPYFTTKGIGRGTGLGLATVFGAVKQSNGLIHVTSEPHKGSTFSISLPRHLDDDDRMLREITPVADVRRKATILLVEDESAFLSLTAKMLERLGHTVLVAPTPQEAIRLAQVHAGEIGLLITDVVMPEMDGPELASRLVHICPALKRLFMSGYTDDLIARHGMLEEGVQFIQKPFSSQTLSAKVQEVLAGK
jgi:PAS domain S-box-containing protein